MATRGIDRAETGADEVVAHEGFLRYRRFRWLKIALGISIFALLVYLLVDIQPRHNGGSWYGYLLGTIGLLLIVWLSLLGIRKRAITRGRWSLKAWTSAHVYLGLALIVIATLHTGFQLGWNVHTVAYVLMMLVILSGIYGITVYSMVPQSLSDVRSEMTGPQMVDAVSSLDKQIRTASQPLSDSDSNVVLGSLGEDPFGGGAWRRLTGNYPRCGNRAALQFMRGRLAQSTGRDGQTVEQVVSLLERKQAALQRIRNYGQRRALLEIWLYFHVPLTVVLIIALVAHVISVFFYW